MATDPLANNLLAHLPRADFNMLRPSMNVGQFAQGGILAETGDEIDQVYFPLSGMISVLIILRDGKAIETSTIGKDGVFGAAAAFGLYKSGVRAIVQVAMDAVYIPASLMRRHAERSRAIQLLCLRYNEVLLAQARITAACNAMHNIESRFCRWLLQTSVVTDSKTISLTQEFLSEMLGVRRTSVSEVAKKIQDAGIIGYARGTINILDFDALKEKSCECFETLQDQKAI
jgi:CRP-like cAMP-binding protein